MKLVYNKEGNVVFLDNKELCDYMVNTLGIHQVLPQDGPVGMAVDGSVFTVRKHLLATVSPNAIASLEEFHDVDGKRELMLAGLSDFMFRTNEFGTPFNTMYAREIYFEDKIDDSGNAVTQIILRADLR